MHPLPLQWKIFRIANYVHLSGLMGILLLTAYSFFSSNIRNAGDWLIFFAFTAGFSILITNCIINWYLLDRCYPDKHPSRRLLVTAIVIFILSLLGIGFFIFAFSYGVYEMNKRERINFEGIFLLCVFSILIITGVYICWQQVALKKIIRRNYQQTLDNFLTADD